MNIRIRLFLISLTGILLSGCEKYVDIDKYETPASNVEIVIEGYIASAIVPPVVRLSKPASFSEWKTGKTKPSLISGAEVSLSDGTKQITLQEYTQQGYYTTKTNFHGETGKTYTLTIKYNGKSYTATDKLIPVQDVFEKFPFKLIDPATELNGTEYQFTVERHQFGFKTPYIVVSNFNTPEIIGEYGSPEKWSEKVNPLSPFTFDKLDLSEIIFDNNIDVLYAHPSARLDASFSFYTNIPIYTYPKNATMDLYQFSVSDDYYKYLLALFANTEWVGLFSSMPGDLPGNVSEGGVGYFWATDIKKVSFPISEVILSK